MTARIVFWLSALAAAAVVGYAWSALPDRVPLHFGGSGQPDRWGSRTEAVVTMAVLVTAITLLFAALAFLLPRAPRSLVNLPAKDKQWWFATPERRRELGARMTTDMHVIGALTLVFIAGVELIVVATSHQDEPALGAWFWAGLAAYLVAVLGYSGYLVAVRYRRPADATPDASPAETSRSP